MHIFLQTHNCFANFAPLESYFCVSALLKHGGGEGGEHEKSASCCNWVRLPGPVQSALRETPRGALLNIMGVRRRWILKSLLLPGVAWMTSPPPPAGRLSRAPSGLQQVWNVLQRLVHSHSSEISWSEEGDLLPSPSDRVLLPAASGEEPGDKHAFIKGRRRLSSFATSAVPHLASLQMGLNEMKSMISSWFFVLSTNTWRLKELLDFVVKLSRLSLSLLSLFCCQGTGCIFHKQRHI